VSELINSKDYKKWITGIKERVQSSQIKAAVAVNREMLGLYWFLGEEIIERQQAADWGDGFLQQLSRDLISEFPDMKGFSYRNLKYMRQWVEFWGGSLIGQQAVSQFEPSMQGARQQLVAQIPWGHNIIIIQKLSDPEQALFYVKKTIENNWSRAVLTHQIESGLHLREGQALSNFEATLPAPQSDLAQQILRDPYQFDFLSLSERHSERELENALVEHLSKFLLELGAGFAYVGRQHRIEVDGEEFFIDLLFYHLRLHCYVVIELKVEKFKPEHVGKLNFYISAVDAELKSELDNPTIGILICKSKSDIVVEYSLRDVSKPIGVSEYEITQSLPEGLRGELPSIEEIEAELGEWEGE
jgi:predicted nuclease of restriction endonuclease-like (RecB) superfamily